MNEDSYPTDLLVLAFILIVFSFGLLSLEAVDTTTGKIELAHGDEAIIELIEEERAIYITFSVMLFSISIIMFYYRFIIREGDKNNNEI